MENRQTNPSDSAFAKAAFYHPEAGTDYSQDGLTKLEYFAVMAMQSLIVKGASPDSAATQSLLYADSLIKKLCNLQENEK